MITLCVNDAMGAIACLSTFAKFGREDVMVASFRQNPATLARRIQVPAIMDAADPPSMQQVVEIISQKITQSM